MIRVVSQKGTPNEVSMASWRILTTRYNLAVAPRVLVVSFGTTEGIAAADSLREVLEGEGFRVRALPAEPARAGDEPTLSEWARSLGCHVAVSVTAGATQDNPGAASTSAPAQPPYEGGARVRAFARGWVVDSLRAQNLGRAQAEADLRGPDPIEARARAAARAGRELGYSLLAPLEQSGWVPPGSVRTVAFQVIGLPHAGLVEQIEIELAALAEARRVTLWEVGHRRAVWRAEMVDTGLQWDTVVTAIRLREGRIAWRGSEPAAGEVSLGTWLAEWVEK